MNDEQKRKRIVESKKEPTLKIWVYEDDTIIFTDEKDELIDPKAMVDLPGPSNTYAQIVLSHHNSICAMINGRMH